MNKILQNKFKFESKNKCFLACKPKPRPKPCPCPPIPPPPVICEKLPANTLFVAESWSCGGADNVTFFTTIQGAIDRAKILNNISLSSTEQQQQQQQQQQQISKLKLEKTRGLRIIPGELHNVHVVGTKQDKSFLVNKKKKQKKQKESKARF